ncbi:transcriptional regulator [Kutzneria albida]|uniref:transcriptional regulator n=1 Tax=Kutzneria albida TaxID=43357 RepID=UPI0011DCD9BA|nr:transcriptional regulator [Kutzneria albida]
MLEQKIWERRQTLEEFAEYAETFAREQREPGTLGVRHLQRLASGHGPKGQPLGPVRPATARLLESIFNLSVEELLSPPDLGGSVRQSDGGAADLGAAFEWLDERGGWSSGTAQRKVEALLGGAGAFHDQQVRRAKVSRSQLVGALAEYYVDQVPGHGFYGVRCGSRDVVTSILAKPSWLDLARPLGEGDQLTLVPATSGGPEVDLPAAVRRLAEAAALGVRMTNAQLYRLVDLDAQPGKITGSMGVTRFVEYALTMDLLESELVDSIATASSALRLRDRYLPDLASVLDVSNRLCVGGVLALCAIARPADPYRGAADYALLVQERSGHVLNATGRLAVIPKGFHEPMTDVRAEVQIGSTLLREMEEELFGRGEVDSTAGVRRAAAPMHPARVSEPMRWLLERADRLRMECTGFGLNLVSGNY